MELPLRRKNRNTGAEIQPARWICNVCGKEYPYTTDYFPIARNNKWNLGHLCLQCDRERIAKKAEEKKRAATVENEHPFSIEVIFECAVCHQSIVAAIDFEHDVSTAHWRGFSVKPKIGPICLPCADILRKLKDK